MDTNDLLEWPEDEWCALELRTIANQRGLRRHRGRQVWSAELHGPGATCTLYSSLAFPAGDDVASVAARRAMERVLVQAGWQVQGLHAARVDSRSRRPSLIP